MTAPDGVSTDGLVSLAARKMRRRALAEAAAILTVATELEPANDEAWRLLAEIHHREERLSAAIGCYRRALETAPRRVALSVGLASAYADAGRFTAAADVLRVLASNEPWNPDVLFGYALALHRDGRSENALEMLDRAVSLAPDAPYPRMLRSTILLSLGRLAEGWGDHDARLAIDQASWQPALPLWDGSSAPGMRLLVTSEGGFGDNIWAARFLPAARKLVGSIHFAVQPRLRALFANIEGVDELCEMRAHDGFDAYCPILSLPVRLNVTDPTAFPPAKVTPIQPEDSCLTAHFHRTGQRLRVGIIWSGNESYSENRHRAASLEVFMPIVERPDIQVFSLQKGNQQRQLRDSGLGDLIIDADDSDLSETAAIVRSLDLVIMTDSAVAHLTGSVGKPIWTLLDCAPHWYFGARDSETPWYPSMRLFRQSSPGDWHGVMAEVGLALDHFVDDMKQSGKRHEIRW